MNNVESPRNDDAGIEQELAAKAVAPRITPADIAANIDSEHYFTAADGVGGRAPKSAADPLGQGPEALRTLTFCVLVLRNGFTVTGESAPASAANFDPEIGKRIARENAVQKCWPLMGYALKQQLHAWQQSQNSPATSEGA